MRKHLKIIIGILLGAALIGIFIIGAIHYVKLQTPTETQEALKQEYLSDNYPEIMITPVDGSATDCSVTVTVYNGSQDTIYMPLNIRTNDDTGLQVEKDGIWYLCSSRGDPPYESTIVAPGETIQLTIDWSDYFYSRSAGHYRIITYFSFREETGAWTAHHYYRPVEFDIP